MKKVSIITPNIPEAEILTKTKISSVNDMVYAAKILISLGAKNVLIKGGHLKSTIMQDIFLNKNEISVFKNKKINTKNIFCTKIASKLARTYTNKHGLKDLINELLGIELDKSSQSSDWGSNEDLTKYQLDYAANDVRYLIEAMHKLKVILKREDRYELAQICFETVSVHAELDILKYSHIFDH